jgi:hypothetical protein
MLQGEDEEKKYHQLGDRGRWSQGHPGVPAPGGLQRAAVHWETYTYGTWWKDFPEESGMYHTERQNFPRFPC